jgi:hypothetical protein
MPNKIKLYGRGEGRHGFEVDPARVLLNDVTLPWDVGYGHRGVHLWVLGNEYGAMGAVWADSMDGAFDELVDADLAGGILIDEEDADDETARLGNAGEPADLTNAWAEQVEFKPERDYKLLAAFAEGRGAGYDTLEGVDLSGLFRKNARGKR